MGFHVIHKRHPSPRKRWKAGRNCTRKGSR